MIFGTWSTTMTSPMPALKPISTGSEIKFATNPRRSRQANKSAVPTSSVNVAEAAQQGCGIATGHDLAQLSGGQDRQGCRRTDAEHARAAEHSVDHHGHQGGIEAYLHRQPGNHRIRHRLGNDHCARGQPRDDIRAQPIATASETNHSDKRRNHRCSDMLEAYQSCGTLRCVCFGSTYPFRFCRGGSFGGV